MIIYEKGVDMKLYEEQVKSHKWWVGNKESIRQRIIGEFNLPKDYKLGSWYEFELYKSVAKIKNSKW